MPRHLWPCPHTTICVEGLDFWEQTSGGFPSHTNHTHIPPKHQLKHGALKAQLVMWGYRRLACLCGASTRKCKRSFNFKPQTQKFSAAELMEITYMAGG